MQPETKRRDDLQARGREYTRWGDTLRMTAAIGTKVEFRDEDGLNFGEIIGIYPHICAIRVKISGVYRVKCRQWHEMRGCCGGFLDDWP